MDKAALIKLIDRYKSDPESVYNTWFVSGEERMKAFRAIRRGVRDTIDSITAATFGSDFKGSPLEVVLTAITEQKQVFEGAAHPFYWKPKLRIPDIYENEANQRTLGAFAGLLFEVGSGRLLTATNADQVLAAERTKGEKAAKARHCAGSAKTTPSFIKSPTVGRVSSGCLPQALDRPPRKDARVAVGVGVSPPPPRLEWSCACALSCSTRLATSQARDVYHRAHAGNEVSHALCVTRDFGNLPVGELDGDAPVTGGDDRAELFAGQAAAGRG